MDLSADHAQTQTKNPDGDSGRPQPPDSQSPPQSHPKSVRWSTELTQEMAPPGGNMPAESNPYVTPSPVVTSSSNSKVTMEAIKGMLGRWGKKAKETAKKTEDYAGNVWQHLKTGPSVADTAMGRIAHTTKVLAEGGYEKIFQNTFETLPDEQLNKSFACYLSTSAGPVVGVLYLSSSKLAFCSDNPLSYQVGDKTEWSYYKVVIPLQQLRKVGSSISKVNRAEKYIQVVSIDNHEFWFMGFMHYDNAVKSLQEASLAGEQT